MAAAGDPAEVAGLPAITLQPAAGSQGELTGLMLMRAYFADRGEDEQRDTIITADTAHGTNPASVTMAGYKLEKVATTERGNLDLDDLRAKVNERTAGLMLTNPSTLGLFDEGIEEVARIFHDAGALLYYDGANLNAVVGMSRPGRHGLRHRPLQPAQDVLAAARRRRPGWRPGRGAGEHRAVPAGAAGGARRQTRFRLDYDRPKSIGRVRGFAGPFGVFVRSYAFMRAYGPALREMSEVAVLNANYLLARLKDVYELPYDRLCMHEFVLSARRLKREHGITALDVAKRLMDFGIHPPTIYFPLVVPEALMIEPTETEPKERLDEFVEAMRQIAREAAEEPETLQRGAAPPAGAPARRGAAAKQPVVRYALREHVGSAEYDRLASSVGDGEVGQNDRNGRAGAGGAVARARAGGAGARPDAARRAARGGVPLQGAAGELDRDAFLEAASGPYEIEDYAYDEIDPEVYGNTAVLVSRYRQRASLDGRDLTHELRVTDVWVRRQGRWQIVRRHATIA